MEEKEAIKLIKKHKEIHFEKEPNAFKITEALDMAISALKSREMVKEKFNSPIQDMQSTTMLLCMAISLGSDGCKNCPVKIFDYEKRSKHEIDYFYKPCSFNLYKWLEYQLDKK